MVVVVVVVVSFLFILLDRITGTWGVGYRLDALFQPADDVSASLPLPFILTDFFSYCFWFLLCFIAPCKYVYYYYFLPQVV